MDLIIKLACVALALFCTIGTVKSIKCYECNVWKAGYGHLCDNPRIRDDCLVCMKVETTVYMGYYKNTPRMSSTESRICAKSHTVHYSHECHRYQSSDGYSTRCYCDKDLCNTGTRNQQFNILTVMLPILVSCKIAFFHWLL